MKKLLLLVIMILFSAAWNVYGQKKSRPVKVVADTISTDSIQYELIIFDVGFEAWLATKHSMNFYSQSFYEMKNRDYVISWNQRADNPGLYKEDYGIKIAYDPRIDYGLELNYRLYYYFLYFEEKNNVKLLSTSR